MNRNAFWRIHVFSQDGNLNTKILSIAVSFSKATSLKTAHLMIPLYSSTYCVQEEGSVKLSNSLLAQATFSVWKLEVNLMKEW